MCWSQVVESSVTVLYCSMVTEVIGPNKDGLCTYNSLPINLNMCFVCSKEPSHLDGSFEYPQHMFWLRNKKNNFQIRSLIWRPGSVQILFARAEPVSRIRYYSRKIHHSLTRVEVVNPERTNQRL